jgi:hypothetical protein
MYLGFARQVQVEYLSIGSVAHGRSIAWLFMRVLLLPETILWYPATLKQDEMANLLSARLLMSLAVQNNLLSYKSLIHVIELYTTSMFIFNFIRGTPCLLTLPTFFKYVFNLFLNYWHDHINITATCNNQWTT